MSVSQREWERTPSTGCQNGAPDRLVITTTQLWGCVDDWVYRSRLAAWLFWVLGFTTQDGRRATHHFGHRQKSQKEVSFSSSLHPPSPHQNWKIFLLQIKTGPFPSYLRPIQPPLGPPLIPSLPLFKGDLFRGRKERRAFCPPPTFLKDALSWKKGRETTVYWAVGIPRRRKGRHKTFYF